MATTAAHRWVALPPMQYAPLGQPVRKAIAALRKDDRAGNRCPGNAVFAALP